MSQIQVKILDITEFINLKPEEIDRVKDVLRTKISGKVAGLIAAALGIGSVGGGVFGDDVKELLKGHDHQAEMRSTLESALADHLELHHGNSIPSVVPVTAPVECAAEVRVDEELLRKFCPTIESKSEGN